MKIKLKQRKLKSGKVSLQIEYYKGSFTLPNGKRKYDREFESLELYLFQNPKSAEEKKKNKETLALAEKILAIRQAEFFQGKFDLKDAAKQKRRFLNFFREKTEEKIGRPKNYANWKATLHHLKRCVSPSLQFRDIDEDFVKKVRHYFDEEAITKSGTFLAENSKYTYYNKFKASMRLAFDEGYLSINYATRVEAFKQPESETEYLTYDEVCKLANTWSKNPLHKKAFLFACLTGLRWSDIKNLKWKNIHEEGDRSRLVFKQQKTRVVEYPYIAKQARELIGKRGRPEENVFEDLKYGMTYNNEYVRWCMRAGITKHITFHCARHTHAVLLLEFGADLYTVSKILGHKEIRTTQIYAKIVDKKLKEASELIPEINIEL